MQCGLKILQRAQFLAASEATYKFITLWAMSAKYIFYNIEYRIYRCYFGPKIQMFEKLAVTKNFLHKTKIETFLLFFKYCGLDTMTTWELHWRHQRWHAMNNDFGTNIESLNALLL